MLNKVSIYLFSSIINRIISNEIIRQFIESCIDGKGEIS